MYLDFYCALYTLFFPCHLEHKNNATHNKEIIIWHFKIESNSNVWAWQTKHTEKINTIAQQSWTTTYFVSKQVQFFESLFRKDSPTLNNCSVKTTRLPFFCKRCVLVLQLGSLLEDDCNSFVLLAWVWSSVTKKL